MDTNRTRLRLRGTTTPLSARAAPAPRLADGLELIGEYRDSGFREAPYIVRLPGGCVVQLTHLLYLVAAAVDGVRDPAAIAARVTDAYGRELRAEHIVYLLEHKLRPLGLLAGAGETAPEATAPLALTIRAAVVPAEIVRPFAALFRPFFRPTIVGAALAWLGVLDVWLWFEHGLDTAVHTTLLHPALLLLVLALVVCSAAFHELGHAAACRFGGARPGAMGVGLYLVWPAFYTDVTDAYRLDRRGRLRTDLGGIYFNVLFVLGTAAVYFRTGFEPLLVFVALQHVQIVNQFVPWLRFDGYYVLTDLTGVPDVLSRVKPVLLSLIPDRPEDRRVAELKPWVRVALSAYVITLVPVLALTFALLLAHAPRFFAIAAASLHLQLANVDSAIARDEFGEAAVAAGQFLVLLLPTLAMTLTLLRLARAMLRRVLRGRRPRLAVTAVAAAAMAVAGFAAAPVAERGSSRAGAATTMRRHARARVDARVTQPVLVAPALPRPTASMPTFTRPSRQPRRVPAPIAEIVVSTLAETTPDLEPVTTTIATTDPVTTTTATTTTATTTTAVTTTVETTTP